MGWFRRLFGPRRSRAKAPPWVSPQFLAVAALAGVAALGLAAWALQAPAPGGDPPGAAQAPERTYVGYAVQEWPTPAEVEAHLDAWKTAHPDLRVVAVEPVYVAGVLVGYWVDHVPDG